MMSGRLLVLFVALAVATVAAGCAPKADSGKPAEGGELVYVIDEDSDSFDLFRVTQAYGAWREVYETLLSYDWDGNIVGGLAHKWYVSEDGKSWTFELLKDIKFHDGSPFNADAVKRHFDLLLDPELAAPSAIDFASIDRVEAVDEYTVVFHLKTPYPNILSRMAVGGGFGSIQSPDAWEKHGPRGDGTYGTEVVSGTGPFKLVSWRHGDQQVVERNPDYKHSPPWMQNSGPAHLDRVIYKIIPDAATRLAELEAGNIHVLEKVPPEHVERIQNMKDVTLVKERGFRYVYLAYANDKQPFSDVRVRKAINLAIDRQDLVDRPCSGWDIRHTDSSPRPSPRWCQTPTRSATTSTRPSA